MVHQHDVAVVVDSSSCLPPDLLRKWRVIVVSHELIIDGRHYRDGIDIHPAEFYQLLKQNQVSLATAAPRPQQFLEAFLTASQLAPNVLCLTLSSNFSVAHRAACAAVQMTDGRLSGTRVEVIDSQAAAGASGLIALAAARWAAAGYNLEQVITQVNQLIPRVQLIAFLDTLYYLGRSGRVGKFKAWAGSLLGIKPVTELRHGEAWMLEKPRSRARAIERMLAIMRERVGQAPVHVNVMEAGSPEDAQALLQHLQGEFRCLEAFVSQFTPVMGTHTGPGLLGIAFWADEGSEEGEGNEGGEGAPLASPTV